MWGGATERPTQDRIAAFTQRMGELGWRDSQNVRFDVRWADRNREKAVAQGRELVELRPDLIITGNTITTEVLRKETAVVPIIFGGASDPLASGLVASLAHPGGNVTGFGNFEFSTGAKWLELLKQVAPSVSRVLVMMQPHNDGNRGLLIAVEDAAHSVAVQVSTADEEDRSAVERIIPTFASDPGGGLIVLPGRPAADVVALGIRYKLPGVFFLREQVRAGGLLSYTIDFRELYRGVANYVDRILRGDNAGDLPVQEPTKFELAINLKTAKALGLTVPPSLLATADEVIE